MQLLKPHLIIPAMALALLAGIATAQTDSSFTPATAPSAFEGKLLRPRLYVGAGPMYYFGDVGHLGGTGHRLQQNWGYTLGLENRLSPNFSLNAYVLFGKISAEERLYAGNVNFETNVQMGGVNLVYNFAHLVPPSNPVRPYLSVGISTFEFNPKTNLQDAEGNTYHYWTDGTVRNVAEINAAKGEGLVMERDDDFETDLRRAGRADYPLRSLSMPAGAGVYMKVNDYFDFKLGAEFHWTLTDNLDHVSRKTNYEKATSKNDNLLFSSVGLVYNLHYGTALPGTKSGRGDFEATDLSDEDADGVVDLFDDCPFSPAGVEVDSRGCPVDTDGDGVADYLDMEPNTPAGSYTDETGTALTEDAINDMYLAYLDSTGNLNYAKSRTETRDVDRNNVVMRNRVKGYRVEIGNSESLSGIQISKLLSISDLKSEKTEEGTVFYLGEFDDIDMAIARGEQLMDLDFEPSIIHNEYGRLTPVEIAGLRVANSVDKDDYVDKNKTVFRVQIGAYRYALSYNVFKDINNLLIIKGSDGLTRYVSGSFTTLEEAAEKKIDLLINGFEGAFVTAYRGGKRITLKEAGARMAKNATEEIHEVKATQSINPELVKYTLQLGTFAGRIPAETLSRYMSLNGVRPMRGNNDATTYVYGEYDTADEAQAALTTLKGKGFGEAKIVGLFNNGVISAEEAQRIKSGH